MRDDGAGDQADAAEKKDEHHDCVEKAGQLKIDLQVHQNAREDDNDAGKQKQPAQNWFAIEKQKADAENERHKRQTERIVTPNWPLAAANHDLVGGKIRTRNRHRQSDEKLRQPARSSARAREFWFVFHKHFIRWKIYGPAQSNVRSKSRKT